MKKKVIIVVILVIAILIGIAASLNTNKEESENSVYQDNREAVINNIPTKEIPDGTTSIDEEGLEIEGFEEENPNMISGNIGSDDLFIPGAKMSSPVYYSQIDSRWKNHLYTATGNSSQTIGTSGCGPTSAAMVVSSIKGAITPADMGDLYVRYGFRSSNNGTYLSAFKWTANYFGIEYKSASSVDGMVELLKQNYYFVVSCGEGLFTYGGHLIVVYGIDGDTLKIYDPYLYSGKFDTSSRKGKVTISGNTVYCSISNFKAYANSTSYHGFLNDNEDSSDPTPAPSVTTTKYVTAKSGLNIRSDAGTSYSKVGALTYGTAVVVYEEFNGWSRIGEGQWVSSEYLSDTNPAENSSSVVFTSYTGTVTAKSGLNIRKGSSTNYSKVGAYTYNTKVTIYEESNGFGRTSKGWVSLQYISKTSGSTTTNTSSSNKYSLGRYKVNTSSGLNVRYGASTSSSIKRTYTNGTVFDTYEISGSWARTPSGWVCLDYCTLLYKY